MFYGREYELKYLEDKYKSDRAEFIILYGRRRIGKTELLRKFCSDKKNIFFVCRECADSEQLQLFSKKLLAESPMSSYINSFKNWEDAFGFIKDIKSEEKKLIVIDEFPYMVMGNKSIPSIIQNLWDEELKNENVMLILCGSSMNFIEREILGEKNPLYGRTTGIYKLEEMDFFTSCKFFNGVDNKSKVNLYSILGGVPHYLNQFDKNLSIDENIVKNTLSKGSVMYSEVEFLMKQELRETSTYFSIIEAVAFGNTKLNDIYMKTQIEKTKINVYLKNLIDLNIIEKEYPVTSGIKKTANISNGLYKIKDNFFKFYFRFIFPYISEIETGDAKGVYEYNVKPFLNEYTSFTFEDVCIQYLREKNKKLELPFRFSKIGRWWDSKNEIDIVAYDNLGNIIYGECKWKNSRVTVKVLEELIAKSAYVNGKYKSKYFYLFSRAGFTDELIKLSQADNAVHLAGIDEICLP